MWGRCRGRLMDSQTNLACNVDEIGYGMCQEVPAYRHNVKGSCHCTLEKCCQQERGYGRNKRDGAQGSIELVGQVGDRDVSKLYPQAEALQHVRGQFHPDVLHTHHLDGDLGGFATWQTPVAAAPKRVSFSPEVSPKPARGFFGSPGQALVQLLFFRFSSSPSQTFKRTVRSTLLFGKCGLLISFDVVQDVGHVGCEQTLIVNDVNIPEHDLFNHEVAPKSA